ARRRGQCAIADTASLRGGSRLWPYRAIQRLLEVSSQRAFARMTGDGGYWDSQIGGLGVDRMLGLNSNSLTGLLTSTVLKGRMQKAFAGIAEKGAERAAPLVAEGVRNISIADAAALVRGGPAAATALLQGQMGNGLIETMVPELGRVMRTASDPVVGQLLSSVTGVDVGGIANNLAGNVNSAIWREIGAEEGAIRANPRATNDPLLIGVFGVGSRL
ncbi:MAG: DUF4197 family protein, partial [Marinomonas sp.]